MYMENGSIYCACAMHLQNLLCFIFWLDVFLASLANIGVPIQWYTYIVVYLYSGVPMQWCTYAVVYLGSGVLIHWCTYPVVYLYSGVPM